VWFLVAVVGASFGGAARGATIPVTTTADAGPGSLRQAIEDANADALHDDIVFAIDTGPQTISPLSDLPAVTNPVTIDGTTQPGFVGTPIIAIDGTSAPAGASGLTLASHTGSTIRGLVIGGFTDAAEVGGDGILVTQGTSHVIEGNYVGIDATGAVDHGNSRAGVACVGCTDCIIGGLTAAARNVVSGNDTSGVVISGGSGTVVSGNYLGTNAGGDAAVGNALAGVFILNGATNVVVGGPTPAAANLLSGNTSGVTVANSGTTGAQVRGNLIGTDAAGTGAVGNSSYGVEDNGAPALTVEDNVIAANGLAGVIIDNDAADGVVVRRNHIGTDAGDTLALGNGTGVVVEVGASGAPRDAHLGEAGAGNVIAFNQHDGVAIVSGVASNLQTFVSPVGHRIEGNAIHDNGDLGIDLEDDGVTADDAGDADSGANGLQNFPVLDAATPMGGSIEVTGTLDSDADGAFTVEFFANATADPSGHGEGERSLGTATVMTDGVGHAAIDVTLPVTVADGALVTATATDAAGNTSEFSAPAVAGAATTTSTSTSTSTTDTSSTTTSTSTEPPTTTSEVPTTTTSSSTESTSTTTTSTTPDTSTTTTSTTPDTSTTTTDTSSTTTSSTTTSTVAPTTTTTSTAPATTSTSAAPTTTTVPPTSTTSTSVASTTTTTTLPPGPCAGIPTGATFASIDCRLTELARDLVDATELAALKPKLATRLILASSKATMARAACTGAKTGRARSGLAGAARKLVQLESLLRSKSARSAPEEIRTSLAGESAAIRSSIGTLRTGLHCPV
jgi:hypothetical protein